MVNEITKRINQDENEDITITEIEPIDIAKLLFPLKGSLGETHGALVERVKSEFDTNNQHAEWTVDFLEATKYLVRDRVAGPWDSRMDIYSLTKKGKEAIQKAIQKYL